MPKYKQGDVVKIDPKKLQAEDPAGLGINSSMLTSAMKGRKLTIITIHTNIHNQTIYYMNDGFSYWEGWILTDPIDEKTYHTNPKINNVIRKMKSLEAKRKENGYAF